MENQPSIAAICKIYTQCVNFTPFHTNLLFDGALSHLFQEYNCNIKEITFA